MIGMRPPDLRGALSPIAARVAGSRFAKPAARAALLAAGLLVLAIIGRSAIAGSGAPSAAPPASPSDGASLAAAAPPLARPASLALAPAAVAAGPGVPVEAPVSSGGTGHGAGAASPEDPVLLNTATVDDLRRLPGVGPKRADAIVALRNRLGRFRVIEDLMKVKGIGRATLRRLRPLVRLDSAPSAAGPPARSDGGGPPVPTGPPPPA
jgi:competence protein ComEA